MLNSTIDLSDSLTIRPLLNKSKWEVRTVTFGEYISQRSIAELELIIRDPKQSLVLRAANLASEAFRHVAGCPVGGEIDIAKNIPAGAGLGGGSSNAATVIKFFCEQLKIDCVDPLVQKLALDLGADVPYIMYGKVAVVLGVGEKIFPVSKASTSLLKSLPISLFLIPEHSSTKAVFAEARKLRTMSAASESENILDRSAGEFESLDQLFALMENDLEGAAAVLAPKIGEVLHALRGANVGKALMSGSGSSILILPRRLQGFESSERELLLNLATSLGVRCYFGSIKSD